MTRVLILSAVAGLVGGAAASAILRWLFPGLSQGMEAIFGALNDITQELQTMSDTLTQLHAKVDALIASEAALETRVGAQNDKLSAAEAARDAAVTELTSTKDALKAVQEQLANMPQDTAAQEAALKAEIERIDGVITAQNLVDAAPVATDPAPAPAPAPTDPSTPTGTETPL